MALSHQVQKMYVSHRADKQIYATGYTGRKYCRRLMICEACSSELNLAPGICTRFTAAYALRSNFYKLCFVEMNDGWAGHSFTKPSVSSRVPPRRDLAADVTRTNAARVNFSGTRLTQRCMTKRHESEGTRLILSAL